MKHIINAHIHTFTYKHIPRGYPRFPVNLLMRTKLTRFLGEFALNLIGSLTGRDVLHRYANFLEIAGFEWQEEVFERVYSRYPLDTQYIVLPMDLRGLNRGASLENIWEQHQKLAELKAAYKEKIIPFIHIDPRSSQFGGPDPAEFIEHFYQKGFAGLKLYPPLGYSINDPSVKPILECAQKYDLPIMVHCARGGVWAKGLSGEDVARLTAPHLYRSVLEKYKNVNFCLAHFGGIADWETFLAEPWTDELPLEQMNWLSQISTMIQSQKYDNLYTDISYTIFRFQKLIPVLKVFLSDPLIRSKTLFGSDYYMSEQEKANERELSILLRAELGEEIFWEIAYENPKKYLKMG